MEEFINFFKNQLEDTTETVLPETDYINADFWDSLTAVTIQMMIEEEYKVNINIKELSNFKSIKDLFEFIQKNR
ncbi:MAG: acyl carrier protein [Flavobacteriaceae bacterium]|jgi:acyl carrier protein|nr:acyl carrier protein [Flavobacteriaceae bacterium]